MPKAFPPTVGHPAKPFRRRATFEPSPRHRLQMDTYRPVNRCEPSQGNSPVAAIKAMIGPVLITIMRSGIGDVFRQFVGVEVDHGDAEVA